MTGTPTIVLASGGTGGHLFPAEALAHALIERGYHVALLTDSRGADFADGSSEIELCRLDVHRTGGSIGRKLRGVFSLGVGLVQAMRQLQRLSPAAIVGFGGYPSLPTVAAGILMGIPVILHEQNAVLGVSNRLLAPFSFAIASSFQRVERIASRDRRKVVQTGNPVRPHVETLRSEAYAPPEDGQPIHLLVTGGSQGASIFTDVLPAALAKLPEALRNRLAIAHQCPATDLERLAALYQEHGLKAETAAFFADMPERYRVAHLVICRGGASTTAELAIIGRPAIIVPYPHHADNQQEVNAWSLEVAGAAIMIKQAIFTPDYAAERLAALLTDNDRLAHMAQAAHTAGRPDAAGTLAGLVGSVLEGQLPEIAKVAA